MNEPFDSSRWDPPYGRVPVSAAPPAFDRRPRRRPWRTAAAGAVAAVSGAAVAVAVVAVVAPTFADDGHDDDGVSIEWHHGPEHDEAEHSVTRSAAPTPAQPSAQPTTGSHSS